MPGEVAVDDADTLTPQDEAELAEAIRAASGPLNITGGGTRPIGAPDAGRRLSTQALRGITLHEPGALTLVARAGTPLAEVETALSKAGQRLPFEPMDHRGLLGTVGEPTIGGVAAANVSGPRRIQAGACRDAMIGLRFVDGTGTIVKSGGRVMKNVTGFDLVRLLAGSFGTLGVLSEVAFKVLPAPESCAGLCLRGLDDGRAVQAMTVALGTPFEVTGAAHLPGQGTYLRIEGFADSVAYRSARLAGLLEPFGAVEIENDAPRVGAQWRDLRDVAAFHGRPGDVWRVSVKPSDGPRIVACAEPLAHQLDWGGGLVWLLMEEGCDLRARLGGIRGHATLVRAAPESRARLPSFQPEPAPISALASGLRARFDPHGLLNPAVM